MANEHIEEMLDVEWFVVENDEIGGWDIATVDAEYTSQINRRQPGVFVVAECICLDVADHIVYLHNTR